MDIEKEVYKITTKVEEKKKKQVKATVSTIWRPRYIHEVFTQERLIRDAVQQEYLNRYSLVRWTYPDPNDPDARGQEKNLFH